MATNNNNQKGKENLSEGYRGNGVHAPTFKKIVPMPPVKPAPTSPTTKSSKK